MRAPCIRSLSAAGLTREHWRRLLCCATELLHGPDAAAAAERVSDDGLCTRMWWAARAAMLQQRLLARGAASLRSVLLVLHARTLAVHGAAGASAEAGRRLRRVAAAAHLEAAHMEHEYRRARCGNAAY